MIGIVRYLRGYVKIRVWGYSPERFMNLCTNRGIWLWGLSGGSGCYTMYIGLSDFFALREIVRKTKTRVAVLERKGLPFFVRDVRRRKMFAAGLILCLLFLVFMSRFVWAIELSGNRMITDDELYTFLKEEGVSYGTPRSRVSTGGLEEALRETFFQITWASVSLEGSRISIQIRENDLPTLQEQEADETAYPGGADLVAAHDGQVVRILTRSGVPRVKAGDSVEKGQVLISGLVPVANDDGTVRSYEPVTANGDIEIEYVQGLRLTQPFAYQYKNYTGREKAWHFLVLGEKRYRLPGAECRYVCCDQVQQQTRLRLFGQIDLPVFVGTVRCREYLPVDAVYDRESAVCLLEGRFQKIIAALEEKGVQIAQKDVKIVRKTDALLLEGELTLRQAAAFLQAADRTGLAEEGTAPDGA
ncbi:MAG: sporulation protein YqfD [Eubacteriales bacterium]|nr:sporulation protein YqfD [Eubacteriales bacterium]